MNLAPRTSIWRTGLLSAQSAFSFAFAIGFAEASPAEILVHSDAQPVRRVRLGHAAADLDLGPRRLPLDERDAAVLRVLERRVSGEALVRRHLDHGPLARPDDDRVEDVRVGVRELEVHVSPGGPAGPGAACHGESAVYRGRLRALVRPQAEHGGPVPAALDEWVTVRGRHYNYAISEM